MSEGVNQTLCSNRRELTPSKCEYQTMKQFVLHTCYPETLDQRVLRMGLPKKRMPATRRNKHRHERIIYIIR